MQNVSGVPIFFKNNTLFNNVDPKCNFWTKMNLTIPPWPKNCKVY